MRVALYARVSTTEQAINGLSIDAQLAELREASKTDDVVGEFVDDGYSAKMPIKKRPRLMALLHEVERGAVDLILFTRLDRWTRNIREYYKAQDVLEAHGVAWKALREDYETQTAAGRLKVNIMLAVAQDEADRTSERVKAVFEEKRRKGLEVNGHMPIGLNFNDGHPIPNADADKVRALFAEYIGGRGVNDLSMRSPDILGKVYSPRSIQQLLTNEKFLRAGVVTPETFEAARTTMERRATRTVRSDRVYLFSGLLVCPVCGYKLTVRTSVYKGKRFVYYRCDQYGRVHRCSWGSSVREDELEAYLMRHIMPAVEGYNLRITSGKKKPVDLAGLQRKLDRLTDLYLDEKIDKDDFDRRAEPLRGAIRAARLTPQAVDTDEIRSALDTYEGLSKAAQRAFWRFLVRRIVPEGGGYEIGLFLP